MHRDVLIIFNLKTFFFFVYKNKTIFKNKTVWRGCMRVIIVTGTPGTGKTALSKKLAKKLAFRYLDVGSIIKKCNFSEDYDEKRKTHIVDAKKLNRELVREIMNCKKTEKGVIIDSHLSHYLPKKYVDLCIVTKCNLRVLEKRLRKKNKRREKKENKKKNKLRKRKRL